MAATIARAICTLCERQDRCQSIIWLFFELFHNGTRFAWLDRWRDRKCHRIVSSTRLRWGCAESYVHRAVRTMPERRDHRIPTTRDVAARGARIRFVEAGRGPPLMLVHDCLASRLAWDDVLAPLSRRFHVIAPDLPGFGESEKPAPGRYAYDFDAFSESLGDIAAALGLVRLSLCGHGLGGAVALTLAAEHAHLV